MKRAVMAIKTIPDALIRFATPMLGSRGGGTFVGDHYTPVLTLQIEVLLWGALVRGIHSSPWARWLLLLMGPSWAAVTIV